MTDTITSQPLDFPTDRVATPLREGRLVIRPSFVEGAFDSHAVDCPFVFSVEGRQGMTYVGWDGIGYQTALAWNDGGDWTRVRSSSRETRRTRCGSTTRR